PKRRYKEFEFGNEWEQLKLGDHANILTGGTPNTSIPSYWEPKEIPWMSSGEVNRRRLDKTDNMISKDGIQNSSARWVKKHSILIALAGQGKTRGMVAVNNIPLTTNQSVAAIEPDKALNYEFVFQNLFRRYDELRRISSGDGTRGGLNKQIVSDILISSPNIAEQKMIGAFFETLDSLITLHQHKLDKLKNLKKSYLAEFFPAEGERIPKRRFPGFEGEWKQRKLGEILVTVPYKKFMKVPKSSGQFEVIQQGYDSIIGFADGFPCNEFEDVVIFGDHTLSLYKPQKPFFVGTDGVRILKGKSTIVGYYLYALLERYKPKNEGYKRYYGILTNVEVAITNNPIEQNKIASLFQKLDKSISLQQQKLDKLKNLKKAYLNELFV
ncbi:restriction endonuclease subunit S, partial [Streptococcus sp. SM3]|uniref:restriction endonuclease subunit S n=1 Tax=Streptococcus sp. SM3 TaxID=2898231 RepID=UPI0022B7A75E